MASKLIGNLLAIQDKARVTFGLDVKRAFKKFTLDMSAYMRRLEGEGVTVSSAIQAKVQAETALILQRSGYDAAVRDYLAEYEKVAKATQALLNGAGVKSAFTQADAQALETLGRIDFRRFTALGDEMASFVSEAVMRAGIGGEGAFAAFTARFDRMLAEGDFAGALGANLEAAAQTLANTAVAEFQSEVVSVKTSGTPGQKFVYYGPEDEITRPWCQERLDDNEPLTREEIDALDPSETNLSGDNFIGRGGYNCRHGWQPEATLD